MPSAADKSLARSSPAGYAFYCSEGTWIPAEHLLLLNEKLADVAAGRTKRLMVFMPPRHGKSELISRYFPAWYLGRFPERKVMLTSYADTFAASWGRQARDVFSEFNPGLFGVDVNKETAGGGQWEVQGHRGIMVTAGVGGGITGKGADLLIIDDPVKNADDAGSETIQEKQINWWKSTARTRLMPGGAVVLVMTRWHEGDLAGQLLRDWQDNDADAWEVISLPGIAEDGCTASYPPSKTIELGPDPLGRAPGEALWPAMYPVDVLEATRRAMGNYWFNAMYQQRPADAAGNLFKKEHFRYYTRDGSGLVRIHRDGGDQVFDPGYAAAKFMTVDCASSDKTSADYTVVSTWLVTPDRDLLLWDRERFQFQGPDVKLLIRRVFFEQRPGFVGIERAQAGQTIIQELVREGIPVVPLVPDTDKLSRALPAVARYEEHRVYHPMGPGFDWVLDEWEPELLKFPNASHDDQVDTVAYAGLQLPFLGPPPDPNAVSRTRPGKGTTLTGGLLSRNL